MTKREETRDPWDALLYKTMQNSNLSRKPLSDEELLLVALGKTKAPESLDKREEDLLELLQEVVQETEPAETVGANPLHYFTLKIGAVIEAFASTLAFSQAEFATVRSGGASQALEATTDAGTTITIANTVRGENELSLSWDRDEPSRAILRLDGELVESAPVEAGRVSFHVRRPGLYQVVTKDGRTERERFSFGVELI